MMGSEEGMLTINSLVAAAVLFFCREERSFSFVHCVLVLLWSYSFIAINSELVLVLVVADEVLLYM